MAGWGRVLNPLLLPTDGTCARSHYHTKDAVNAGVAEGDILNRMPCIAHDGLCYVACHHRLSHGVPANRVRHLVVYYMLDEADTTVRISRC